MGHIHRETTMMTRLAIVVLFAGLIGPAMAAAPETQSPPQKTAGAAKAPGSAKVIADILAVSGIQKMLEKAPGNFLTGFHNSLEKMQREKGGRLPTDLQEAMENSVRESYTADGFTGRVTRAMKKDYNAKNYQELLTDLSTPLAQRMADPRIERRSLSAGIFRFQCATDQQTAFRTAFGPAPSSGCGKRHHGHGYRGHSQFQQGHDERNGKRRRQLRKCSAIKTIHGSDGGKTQG